MKCTDTNLFTTFLFLDFFSVVLVGLIAKLVECRIKRTPEGIGAGKKFDLSTIRLFL